MGEELSGYVEEELVLQQQRDTAAMCIPVQHHAAKKLAFHDTKSAISAPKITPSTCMPTSSVVSPTSEPSAEVIEIEECEGDQMQTSSQSDDNLHQGSQLLSAMSTAETRAELAALATLLPQVESSITSSVLSSHAEVTWNCMVYSDPCCLVQRPCETTVKQAEKLFKDKRKKRA